MNYQFLNFAVASALVNVRPQLKTIGMLHQQSEKVWAELVNEETKSHLISNITVSKTKSDAINVYIAKLSKLLLTCKELYLNGFTNDSITKNNDELTILRGYLSTTPGLTNDKTFKFILVNMFGYDPLLIDIVLKYRHDFDNKQIWNDVFKFIVERFELADGIDDVIVSKTRKFQLPTGEWQTEEYKAIDKTRSDIYMNGLLNNEIINYIDEHYFELAKEIIEKCDNYDPIKWLISEVIIYRI